MASALHSNLELQRLRFLARLAEQERMDKQQAESSGLSALSKVTEALHEQRVSGEKRRQAQIAQAKARGMNAALTGAEMPPGMGDPELDNAVFQGAEEAKGKQAFEVLEQYPQRRKQSFEEQFGFPLDTRKQAEIERHNKVMEALYGSRDSRASSRAKIDEYRNRFNDAIKMVNASKGALGRPGPKTAYYQKQAAQIFSTMRGRDLRPGEMQHYLAKDRALGKALGDEEEGLDNPSAGTGDDPLLGDL